MQRIQQAVVGVFLGLTPLAGCGPEQDGTPVDTAPVAVAQVESALDNPIITFKEGNGCTQDQVGWFTISASPYTIPNTSGSGWVNDEARSMDLFGMPAGTLIYVFNSPNDSRIKCEAPFMFCDDWTRLEVLNPVSYKCVYSFQTSDPYGDVDVQYHSAGGLDGQVSRVEVYLP
jgi:hypothetical protein